MRAIIGTAAVLLLVGCGGKPRQQAAAPAAASDELGPPARLEDLRGKVVSIEVLGMATPERSARAREGIKKNIGTPFDRTHVAGWVHFVASLSGVADVVAEARPAKGGVAVRLMVKEHPVLRSVDVRGSQAVPATEWLNKMGIKAGDYFDPVLTTARRHDMVGTLQQFGHFTADVAWTVEKAADGRVDLIFTVAEGPAVVVSKIDLKGNKAVKRDALLEILTKNGGTSVGQRYWREAMSNALVQMSSHYYDRGYINVQIDGPQEALSPDKNKMALTLTIREGDRYRLGKVDAKGTLLAPVAEYVKLLGVKPGEIFNRGKLAKGLEKINEMHKSKGSPATEVFPVTDLDPKKKTVAITLQVQGPPQPAPQP